MATRVGYIGLGNMGKPIATNVLQGGYELIVYDVREAPLRDLEALGAKVAGSPREVGELAEIVELSVVDDAQVEEVVLGEDGVLAGAEPGTIIAVHSTIHPSTVRRIGEIAAARGVQVLDAEVSGGQTGARQRTLCYMVGGDRAAFERCRPVFATSGAHVFHVGGLGQGAATKLAQQVIVCINRLAAYEGMRLAEKAGVDPRVLEQVIRVTNAQSRVAERWVEVFSHVDASESQDAWGMAHLFWQGLCPALELGHELGLAMPGTALVQQRFPWVLGLKE
jgi:3-hydroxyisobutyrate dehydrogenase-like beta-hydroxyacid dehydrogenase